MMYQQQLDRAQGMQGFNTPGQEDRTYQHYYSNGRDHGSFSRVVVVPASNVKKIRSVSDARTSDTPLQQNPHSVKNSAMDTRSIGHRQPIEHPNDQPPPIMSNGSHHDATFSGENHLMQGMGRLHLHEANVEHLRHSNPPQFHSMQRSNSTQARMTQAMMQSKMRVREWQERPSINDESGESFVIDDCASTRSVSESESYSVPNSSSRSSFHNDVDYYSDDETGLAKSLTGIQKPPDVDTTCSRQNSNGSQSSLESNLSFHTVYPSGDGFLHVKSAQQKQSERRRQHQVPPMHHEPHHQSTRHQATSSTEPYMGRSQSQPALYAYNPSPSEQSSGVRQINKRADEASRQDHVNKPTSVFITYAEEQHDKNFKKLVLQLTRTLLNNGLQVRLDMLESTLMSMSVSSWLDDNIEKCDFVIMCVSPSYKSEVEKQITNTTPDSHSLHTRYIYQRLLTQYIQNGSLNYRFIPVLIGGATRKDLPSLCQDTHVYEWPKDFEAIIYRLFKKEKYIQPKVGPPPKCTVETYDSYDARYMNG